MAPLKVLPIFLLLTASCNCAAILGKIRLQLKWVHYRCVHGHVDPPVEASNEEVARALPKAINSLLTQAGKACRLANVDQRVDQGSVPGVPPQRGTTQHMVPVNVSLGAASRADGSFQGGEHGDSEPTLTEQLEAVDAKSRPTCAQGGALSQAEA